MIYIARCIGGPYAGQLHIYPRPSFDVVVFNPPHPIDPDTLPSDMIETFNYQHMTNDFGDWWVHT